MWLGTLVDSSKGVVMVFVSDKKWEKSKTIILRITIELGEGVGLNHKQ